MPRQSQIKRIIGNQLAPSAFLADGGAICLNRTEGWTRGDPMRLLTLFASLAALSALAPIAQAQQDNALRRQQPAGAGHLHRGGRLMSPTPHDGSFDPTVDWYLHHQLMLGRNYKSARCVAF
jgi:hypothetical protein